MFVPLWMLICFTLLLGVNVALDLVRMWRSRRHHDHLLPNTPRSPRG